MALQNNVVLYDGYCNLCDRSIRLLKKTDRKKKLCFIPIQSDEAEVYFDIFPELPDSVVLYADERFYVKSDAVLKTASIAGGWVKILKLFYLIPRPLRDYLYDIVAAGRHRWFGKKEVCELPVRK